MKYIPYILLIVISVLLRLLNLTYFETDMIGFYLPSAILFWQLRNKVKVSKELGYTAAIVMFLAIVAQLLGYNQVWTIPEQHLVSPIELLFPVEEFLYWHGGMTLPILIFRHMKERICG